MGLITLINDRKTGQTVAVRMNSGPESTTKKPEPLFMEPYMVPGTGNTYDIPWGTTTPRLLRSVIARAENRRLRKSAEEALQLWDKAFPGRKR